MNAAALQDKFRNALDALVEQIKLDRSILSAILCGSLSYDTVWAKSDIDLVLVTIDDKKTADCEGLSLYADGINVHAFMLARAEFRKTVEGSIRNSFMHSLLAKGRLLYSHDETIETLFSQLQKIGERDTQVQLMQAGASALLPLYKAHKWLLTRSDLEYAALWMLYAASSLAKVEVLSARMLLDREALPQAIKLNPGFFRIVYNDLLNSKKTPKNVEAALHAMDGYLAERAENLFGPILDHLREVGEARSATEIDHHFARNFGVEGVTIVCEYLADQRLLSKVSVAARLTKKSNVNVEELAFVYAR